MVSKAIASLDAWFVRAEAVLAEQRDHGVSPTLGLLTDHDSYEWTLSLGALSDGLAALLGLLCRNPGRWILIIEAEQRRQLFWQALAFEDGSLCTEVVSNTYLFGDDQWTDEQEHRLLEFGWDPPSLPGRPNYIHAEDTTSPAIDVECRRALATLRKVFGLNDDDEVFIKLFSSMNRGDTPATPLYEQGGHSGEG